MPGELHYDPEQLAILVATYGQVPVPVTPPEDVYQLREMVEQMMRTVIRLEPYPEGITQKEIPIQSHDGKTIQLHRFSKEGTETEKPGPAVLYIHGGGMIACSVDTYAPLVARYAERFGVDFFAVDYRLAPEQKDDGLVKDAYAALEYLSTHAAELGINPARLATMGDSAGSGIAAGLSLMARDRALSPPISKQLLIYPMLDDRLSPGSSLEKFLFVWGPGHSKVAWKALLGEDKAGKEDAKVSIYAVPARATDLSNLPDTYVEVGGLDLFADEVIAFVGKLAKAGVQTEFHLLPGLIHGFDCAPITPTKFALEARERILKTL